MTAREGRALGGTWSKAISDWIGFNKKTINLIGSFKFARERVNLRQVWRMSGSFPGNVEVNNSRFHNSKTTLHDYLGRITKFPNFQIKYISYISKIDQEKESNVKNQIKIQVTYYPDGLESVLSLVAVNLTNTTELTNLSAFTMYVINISAVSSGGVGPWNTVKARTDDAGTEETDRLQQN